MSTPVRARVTRARATAGETGADDWPEPGDKVVTVAEARERYPDEWIVLAVTRWTKLGVAHAGRVVGHTPDTDAAYAAAGQYARQHPKQDMAIFYNGEVEPPPGEEVVL